MTEKAISGMSCQRLDRQILLVPACPATSAIYNSDLKQALSDLKQVLKGSARSYRLPRS